MRLLENPATLGAWLWACLALEGPSPAAVVCDAVTPQQIDADWDRQDLLRETAGPSAAGITVHQDAAGGCDGIKDGKWGFHTAHERQPWWQVDLGRSLPLDRVLLFNRCDQTAARNSRILVLLSEDGREFEVNYQHNGTRFLGKTDGKPLAVSLRGQRARFVRVQLPGTDYLHLDEVEVYAAGSAENAALRRPASQSSTSQWSVRHDAVERGPRAYFTDRAVERGRKLAASLRALGADVAAELRALEDVAAQLQRLPRNAPEEERRALDRRARWAVRAMALRNPLLDFDRILFVKRAPTLFPHMSDQFYGWWSRGGGGVYVLSGFRGNRPQVRCLTAGWPEGDFLRPDLSYDGTRVLFAACRHYPHVADMEKVDKEQLPEDAFYHIFEMRVDGSGLRQLTRGRYDDFDARYLPDGNIVFLSTRKGQAIQVGQASGSATMARTCPDSYVRCGGDNRRPVAVFTLHVMDGNGGQLRPISAFENFEWTPAVAHDGRILYARWDYIDRFNGPFISLWSANPDGTNAQLVYGNFTTRPQCVFEARPVPDSQKLVFTAAAHHSITGGSLVLLNPAAGTEFERPLTRLTPEVPFPETEGWPGSYYGSPYPLSEEHFLVSWSDRPLPPHRRMPPDDPANPGNAEGIYLYDAFGNLTLLHRDPRISCQTPLPIRARPRPPVRASDVARSGPQEGAFLLRDVYLGLPGVSRDAVKRLRIVGVPPKVQPHMNQPVLGVSREDPGKFVMGTVPVEGDGSAYFRVPSGIPVFFQALDHRGLALQTMRTLTYVQPNETLSCIGCHEPRLTAPPPGPLPLAARRLPSKLAPGPEGSWPLRFDRLVQPVLDRHCASCHRPGAKDPAGAAIDLTASRAYDTLIGYAGGQLRELALEKDQSIVGQCPASNSKLFRLVAGDQEHYGTRLAPEDVDRLVTWMDTYAHRLGSFSDPQEEQLRQLRRDIASLLDE